MIRYEAQTLLRLLRGSADALWFYCFHSRITLPLRVIVNIQKYNHFEINLIFVGVITLCRSAKG